MKEFDPVITDLCKRLKPVIGSKADALWISYILEEDNKKKAETESMIKTLAAKKLMGKIDTERIHLPPPSKEEAQGKYKIGTVFYGEKELYPLCLNDTNFIKHIGSAFFKIGCAGYFSQKKSISIQQDIRFPGLDDVQTGMVGFLPG